MACGCQNTCGCTLIEGDNIDIAQMGDTFTISAVNFINTVSDTDCIDLEVDFDGNLTATPILNPDPSSVNIECGPDGLEAVLTIDPASTAIVTQSAAGLQVDIPPIPPTPDTTPAGFMDFSMALTVPPNWLVADGSQQLRAVYPALWDAITLVGSTATRNSASAVITGIDSTEFARAGMVVEATDFPAATILSVDSPTQVTLDQIASGNGSDTIVRIYPFGDGDGLNTFNIPAMDRRFPLGYDSVLGGETVGSQGGVEDVTLGVSEIPAHDHNVTADQSPHTHTGTTDASGNHVHDGAGNNRYFAVAGPPGGGAPTVSVAASSGGGGNQINVQGYGAGTPFDQGDERFTAAAGSHSHAFTSDATDPTINVTEDSIGGGDPHENMPPYIVGRWLVHV